MQEIILASCSKGRRDLLRQIGVKFRVVAPRIRERRSWRGRCADLVVRNAVAKARDVAGRVDGGVVIGADTLVRVGRRIIGKPRSLSEAVAILKLLSRRPQWVYTGLAVIDARAGTTLTACEMTKVIMRPLGEAEIAQYFMRVRPLTLAGSFDVQGHGAVFVERIEGCFYNVVGLPLARLAGMLQGMGIVI